MNDWRVFAMSSANELPDRARRGQDFHVSFSMGLAVQPASSSAQDNSGRSSSWSTGLMAWLWNPALALRSRSCSCL